MAHLLPKRCGTLTRSGRVALHSRTMLAEIDRLCVVLVETSNPLNIGAAARAMSNFGALRMRVVNPYDVAFREARSAVGGAPVLQDAVEFGSLAEAVADCTLVVGTTAVRHRELHHALRRLETGAGLIREELTTGSVALVFGPEKTGLSNDDLSHCHWLMSIPTREQHISMNLGQAVAVCLYELVRESGKPVPAPTGEAMGGRAHRGRSGTHLDRFVGGVAPQWLCKSDLGSVDGRACPAHGSPAESIGSRC